MLRSLHIENIAVVERADVDFREGLNVLTGETGAGKSIIIDALNAVTGGRTSRDLVRSGSDRALAAAVFDASSALDWCQDNGIEPEDGTLVVQRVVTADGRGSCKVNGVPVTVSQLRSLGASLLDIHGQNDGRQLMDENRHLDYLDAFAGDGQTLAAFESAYRAYQANEKEIDRLTMDDNASRQLAEVLTYRVQELKKASLKAGEEQQLEERSSLLRNSEKLREAMEGAYAALYGGEESAVELTGQARGWLSRAVRWSQDLNQANQQLEEAEALLQDAAERIRDLQERMDFSPQEFDQVESRLAQLHRLEKKYSVVDEDSLLRLYEQSVARLEELEYSGEKLEKLKIQRQALEKGCRQAAKSLTQVRQTAGEQLSLRVKRELKELSMPSVQFVAEISPVTEKVGFNARGGDVVRFLMSANAGEAPGRLSKIASGGELSRIMLALKTVFGEKDPVPTAVFDEIDTGVSGIAASRVGEKLAVTGRSRQVLCVSHLPQIAAMADSQYLIEKQEKNGRTYTTVKELDREGRRREIARLIGGENITDLTTASAEEQLAAAEAWKKG